MKRKGRGNYDEKEGKEEEHGGKGEETEKQNKNLSVSGIHLLTEILLCFNSKPQT